MRGRFRHTAWLRTAAALCSLGLVLIASCKDATQARVTLRTNVEYRQGLGVAVWASGRSDSSNPPLSTSQDPWLQDGTLGDLVITPRTTKDEPLFVRVTMGVGRDPSTCSDADAKNCIIAKRKLRFVPNTGLRIPVVLHLACTGVVCSADTTCNYLGQCVSAEIDASACGGADGCALPGDETVTKTVPDSRDAGDSALSDAGDGNLSDSPLALQDAGDSGALLVSNTMAAGSSHTCARLSTGQVKCWGRNDVGQLGLGDVQDRGTSPVHMGAALPFVDLGPGRTVLQLGAGIDFTCARLDNGQIKCWGLNDVGQLGLGDTQSRGASVAHMGSNLPAVDLGPGRTASLLAVATEHACARLDNGDVKCWGRNDSGELGLGDTITRGTGPGQMGINLPALDLGRTVVTLAAGGQHTCFRLDDSSLKCIGQNGSGELGLGDVTSRGPNPGQMGNNLPSVDIGAGRVAVETVLGLAHTCARMDNGLVKCWGLNLYDQLGSGNQSNSGSAPGQMGENLLVTDLGPGRTVVSLSAGAFHTCARLDNGELKCWGRNDFGHLGLGDTVNRGDSAGQMGANLPPVDLGPGRVSIMVVGGLFHTCARLDTGEIKCWGSNGAGQLGLGDNVDRGAAAGQMGANLPVVLLQ